MGEEWVNDENEDNIAHNRQTRSLFPENKYRNIKNLEGFNTASSKGGHCANMNGALDVRATKENFGNTNYTTKSLNANVSLAIEAIENIEKNFAYVNVLEFRELSLGLLKIILRIYKSDEQSAKLIKEMIEAC